MGAVAQLNSRLRWFELPDLSVAFYITEDPQPGSAYANTGSVLATANTDAAVPVTVLTTIPNDPSSVYVPKTVSLSITYYQMTSTRKRIVGAFLVLDDFVRVRGVRSVTSAFLSARTLVSLAASVPLVAGARQLRPSRCARGHEQHQQVRRRPGVRIAHGSAQQNAATTSLWHCVR